jgi:CHAT domain-containing protein
MAGLGVLVCATGACRPATDAPSGRDALASAVSTTLPFHARLSGGFAPSKVGPTRAAGDRAPDLSPDTRIAIALLEKRATETPTPEALADLGVAYLVQGDLDRAIATIEDAASQMTSAAPWSDLSAAYLAKAERTPSRKVEYLARALEAAERSLKIARTNDALFNRALAGDGLAPYTGTPTPWAEFTASEKDPAWRAAAAEEASNDRPIDDVRERWEARRKELAVRLVANDAAFANETARLHPEAATEILEQELLVSESTLPSAALLASAIVAATNDPMAADEIAAVRSHPAQLIQAHQWYVNATRLYNTTDIAGARRVMTEARDVFRRLNAPYRLWAETRLATADWREGQFDNALRALERIAREARERRYTSLLGRVLAQQAEVFKSQWRLTEALTARRASASQYQRVGHLENATSVYSNLADDLRMLGESQESWAAIGSTLENLMHLRRPLRRYLLLYNATLFASRQGLYNAALIFQDAAVREAQMANPDALTEATLQRALVHVRRGDEPSARADFDRAADWIAAAPAGAFRTYISAEREIVRAQLNAGGNRRGADADLSSAIAYFRKTEPGRVPNLYLLMARAQARSSRADAEAALRQGIESLEAQQAGLADEAFKISFFDESWSLFQDMVSLQVTAHNTDKAFEYAERSQARSLLAAAQQSAVSRARTLSEIQAMLPPSVLIVRYSTLPDRVLIWTIAAGSTSLVERPIIERDLARLVERHRESIRDHRERPANDRLYELVIEPVASALPKSALVVLVPDGPLQQLPFATLRHPSTRRYLIEDHPLLVSPSATFFVDASAAAAGRERGPLSSALLVGNPAAGGVRALPGAENEVSVASKLYPRHEILVGRDATKDRFLARAPSFDVVHFGGHALVNPEFPLLSRLVFADEAEGEQSLYAHEIARVRFPRTRVVVLAACSTAAGAISRGEGIVSVARPFLGGGVPLVIASQWDVDDRATEQLTLAFHRELARSGDPIHALQAAQLALLRSGDAVQALPESWGAFVAVGSTAR